MKTISTETVSKTLEKTNTSSEEKLGLQNGQLNKNQRQQ